MRLTDAFLVGAYSTPNVVAIGLSIVLTPVVINLSPVFLPASAGLPVVTVCLPASAGSPKGK